MNLTELSNLELDNLRADVQNEQERRRTLANAPLQADNLARRYHAAIGVQEGDSWTQPQGAHDAYPEGWMVTHNGKTWVSLIPANVWEPGVSGWREESFPDPETVPDFVQPTGAHDAYNTGDQVMIGGAVWESVIDGNVWSPIDNPEGWKIVDEPEPEEEGPEEDTGPAEWVQPTGGHDAYNTGDRVMFEGAMWESVIDGNTWSPTDNPAGWTKIEG